MWLELVAVSFLAFFLFYRWVIANADYFERRGISHDKYFPLFGSIKDVVFRRKSMFDAVVDLYMKGERKVYGVFDQRVPVYLIRDPELVKQITIKDFDHFVNHRNLFVDKTNLFGKSVFFMRDSKWKDMRSTLSPAFTGSKMRHMFELMNQVALNSVEYWKDSSFGSKNDGIEIDFKDFCNRYSSDIIASTAFGLQVNSFRDKNNDFYRMGKAVTTFTAWRNLKFFLVANFRFLIEKGLLNLNLFDEKEIDYFMHLVLDAMKYRKEHNIFRPDMINMLMEARDMISNDNAKSQNSEWTDIEIVAQCFLFFFAGFESAAVLVSFAAHELMENPDEQQKLFEEIIAVDKELDGKPLSYEILQNMRYLDMVTSETLRKWPAAVTLDRQCNKDFVYESDGERVEIKSGENIWIPVAGFHRDPKYFENPTKFDPERFSDENKDKILPFTYLPFGVGPRNCVGSRFALVEGKSMLYYLLRDFKIEAAKKSTIPLQLASSSFQLLPKNGFWLKFVRRS